MLEFILKYFHDIGDNHNEFNGPATEEQIDKLQMQLGVALPNDYKDFLLFSNGFEGEVGQFVVIFEEVDRIYDTTQITCADFFPWAIFIGSNGSGEMFVIDTRKMPYQFGLLPYISSENDFLPLGDTFEKFIQRLYNDTAFEKL